MTRSPSQEKNSLGSLTLEPGQAPGDTYTIDVSVFRSFATEYAELMGLTPVT
jgi:hypothetical protein